MIRYFFCVHLMFWSSNSQLIINVKNQGGDVMQQNITADVSEDTVTLEFLRHDGVHVTQLVDFTNEVEVMRLIIPGEEDLGQTGHTTLCFLTHAAQADFIAPDAMAKLRQKNPGTVRVAEEDRGWRRSTATAQGARAAAALAPAAAALCRAARVYLRRADLPRWAPRPGLDKESFDSLVTTFPARALDPGAEGAPPPCAERDAECICHAEVCVNWYPCGLKYCKGKPQGGMSYRCGIKTCRRCYSYHFYVPRRQLCPTYHT